MNDQLEKVQEEASKVKTESETLKQQIKELQQTIQNQKKKLLEMNSEESKVKQLASDIRDLETKQKGEKVMFEALLAKSKREVQIRDEQIKELQKVIKNNKVTSSNMPNVTQSVPVTEKVQDKCIQFNCGECKITFKSKNELDNHAHKDHNTGAERREYNLFQRLKNKIVPIEPNEEFKCGKCNFNADTVSSFLKHMCSKEMTTNSR